MSGRILDIGCGHGLLTSLLATQSPRRQVVGIDVAQGKIEIARRSAAAFPNVRYIHGSALDLHDGPYDCITIVDVLYLMPDDKKLELLRHARTLIADDGVLLLKTNDVRPRLKFAVVTLEEWLMVKGLRYTKGGGLHFRSAEQYLKLLDEAGFRAEVRSVGTLRPAPHRLFISHPK